MYVPEEDPYFKDADEDYRPGSERITTRAQLHDELLFTAYFFKGLEHLLAADMNEAKGVSIDDDKPQKPVLTNANNTLILEGSDEKRFKDAIIKPLGIGKKWYPSGNLRYVDTSLPAGSQNQPLPGAQVLIRQVGITYHTAVTDANGHFQMGKLRGHARFYIQWERQKYNIKNKGLWQAEKKGPHQRSPWDHTIQPQHGEDIYHALIHLACLDYYYGSRFQLTAPKNNIRIAARQTSEGRSSHVAARGMFYQISIKKWGDRHCDIYGTTIHELAHSAHREVSSGGYDATVMDAYINVFNPNPNAKRFLETWAGTVELLFVQQRYGLSLTTSAPNTQNLHDDYRQLMQDLATNTMGFYTSCGIDMIDNHNQNSTNAARPVDNVSGYTPKQLEASIKNIASWGAWKSSIKTKYNNPTEDSLDELFANW